MNFQKWIPILLLLSLLYLSCSESDNEFPVGRINLSVDKNAALSNEDTITITAEVLDMTLGKITGVPVTYYADDVQLPSNLFIPTEAGTYILSARYEDIESKIEKVTIISLDDPIDKLSLVYNGVPYLTTDPWSVSTRFDKQVTVGSHVFDISNDEISLYANEVLLSGTEGIHFDEPGVYSVHAELNGTKSNEVEITVRPSKEFEVVEIPLIFHTYGFTPEGGKIPRLLDYLNSIYSETAFTPEMVKTGEINPNAANLNIRFVLADEAPQGKELTSTGLHVLSSVPGNRLSPFKSDVDEVLSLHNWDPEEYINIWVFNAWNFENDDYNDFLIRVGRGMYTPPLLVEEELEGLSTIPNKTVTDNSFIGVVGPAIFQEHPDYVHTMIGYYLGLFIVSAFDCIEEGDFCGDTNTVIPPPNLGLVPTGMGYSCKEFFYRTNNFMCFNLHYTNFTYDQRDRMRTVLAHGNSRPTGI